MSINIHDTEITSNTTSHTATARLIPGQPATANETRHAAPAAARANALGDPCPWWCKTNHAARDKYAHAHVSAPVTGRFPRERQVFLVQDGADPRYPGSPTVIVSSPSCGLRLDPAQAQDLADLVNDLAGQFTPNDMHELAGEIQEAVSFTDPARDPATPANGIPTGREAGQ